MNLWVRITLFTTLKRTAFTALVIFLRYNHLQFKMGPKQAEDFTVDMVNHHIDRQQVVKIIEAHSINLLES